MKKTNLKVGDRVIFVGHYLDGSGKLNWLRSGWSPNDTIFAGIIKRFNKSGSVYVVWDNGKNVYGDTRAKQPSCLRLESEMKPKFEALQDEHRQIERQLNSKVAVAIMAIDEVYQFLKSQNSELYRFNELCQNLYDAVEKIGMI